MSDIEVGDLVVAVRWPCCGRGVGYIWRVEEFGTYAKDAACFECGRPSGGGMVWAGTTEQSAPLSWLKRIPPLEELQTYRQTDETTA